MTEPTPSTLDLMPPKRIHFILALLLPIALCGFFLYGLTLLGDYPSRFGRSGAMAGLLCLPAWLLVFPLLAWRNITRKHGPMGLIMASILAALSNAVLWFLIILGVSQFDFLPIPSKAPINTNAMTPSLLSTAFLIAGIAAIISLCFLPIFGGIFHWIGRKIGAWSA